MRGHPALLCAALAVAAAVTALTAAAPDPRSDVAHPGIVTAFGGQLHVVGDTGIGYVELHNASDRQVVVQAAVSPVAASVLWTTAQQVITSAHLFTASALCEDEPSMQAAADASARSIHDLIIRPGGTLRLEPGAGDLELTELTPRLRRGEQVPVTLYLDNGQQLVSTLVVT